MLKKLSNFIFVAIFVTFSFLAVLNSPVAASDCSWLGPFAGFCGNGSNVNTQVKSGLGDTVSKAITSGITIFFFAVLVVAVFYTLKAAITYVRAEGDDKKVGQAKASMRSILFGVGTMFIAVIAILFIYSFFGASADGQTTGIAAAIDGLVAPIVKLFGGTTK